MTEDAYTLIPTEQRISLADRGMWIYRKTVDGVMHRIFPKTKECMIVHPGDRAFYWINVVSNWVEGRIE